MCSLEEKEQSIESVSDTRSCPIYLGAEGNRDISFADSNKARPEQRLFSVQIQPCRYLNDIYIDFEKKIVLQL